MLNYILKQNIKLATLYGIVSNNITKIMTLTKEMWLPKTQEPYRSIW